MTELRQILRGTTLELDQHLGLEGHRGYNTELKEFRVYDGVTLGGFRVMNKDSTEQEALLVWTARNASRLGEQLPAFYRDASNLNAGTLPAARLSGNYTVGILTATSIAVGAIAASGVIDAVGAMSASAFNFSGGGSAVSTLRNLTAGAGLTGGGTLAADRSFAIGTPGNVNNYSTNTASGTTHSHAFGFTAHEVSIAATSHTELNFGIGHMIVVKTGISALNRNIALVPCLDGNNASGYLLSGEAGAGSALTGSWRVRGNIVVSGSSNYCLAERVN